jgi:hypothetical protein
MSDLDQDIKKLHFGLRNFVNQALDLISYNQFLDDFKNKYQILDGYTFHWALICWFLDLEIVFDRTNVDTIYKNVKYVKQLPEKDIKDCLFYLNYLLGTTVHTGGHNYVKMFDLYKKNIYLSSTSLSRSSQ